MAIAAVLVERATSTALIGPDWAMNLEICDIVNQDPGQAKDVIKTIKKRLGSKNAKIQLLTLTILETLIKNCGGLVHQQVAEKNILPRMVKIVKKQGEMHVKDKILLLLDAWQEAFGGPGGRFSQYYYAYEELRRIGIRFPERSIEDGPPVLTPPQMHPVSSCGSPGFGSPSYVPTTSDAPATSEASQMSLADIETARGSVEVLHEMLNAVNPHDRLAVKDELIVELVDRCRATESRVRQFVNETTNEELLRQGLSLNDDLQQVLAKHDAIQSGTPLPKEEPLPALYDRKDRSQKSSSQEGRIPSNPLVQLALLAPSQSASSKSPPPAPLQPNVDLLSGDVYEDRSAPAPVATPSKMRSTSKLVLHSPAPEGTKPFAPGTKENPPALLYSFGTTDQQQNPQQYASENGNLPHPVTTNGNLQQYSSSNGNITTQVQGFPQHSCQVYETNTVTQPFVPPAQNQHAVSWVMTDSQSLSSQQNGLVSNHGLHSSQLQPPPQLNAYQGHNGHLSSPGLNSPQIPLPTQQNSAYPPAPWSQTYSQPIIPQQTAMLFANNSNSAASMPPQMQLYPDQPSMAYNQQMRLYSGGAQQNTIEEHWTYPQTYPSQVPQAGGQFPAQISSELRLYPQSAMVQSKPVNPADKLFEDLVDLQKLSSKLKSSQISSNKT